ncbi:sensor histidine kinase [Streptomyces sp. NPDC091292]|uniref:sensor histidine kinase n=1 Tax=Streptomyces sp. NPDC091292 TaxID=3365991 RepID=UPI00381B9621
MRPDPLSPALRALRVCLHLLMAGLLALVVVRALTADGSGGDGSGGLGGAGGGASGSTAAVLAATALVAAVYAAGPLLPAVRDRQGPAALWLGALGASWLVLLVLTPDGLWLAFPLYFLELHLLPARWGLPAVAVTAGAAIVSFVRHGEPFTAGAVIGPLLGAAVATATVLGYQALYGESERRRALIGELIATRAELAAAERTAGTLAERERLAREIHDTLAQGLSSIQLLLRAAGRTLPADAPAAPLIEQARAAAQDNLAEARRFVRALAPPDLAHGTLAAALERLCATAPGSVPGAGTAADVKAQCSVSGTPVELPTPYEVALLRIAQSALGNTVRHARARRVDITLSFMDTAVALDVVDDGVGFDTGAGTGSGTGTGTGSGTVGGNPRGPADARRDGGFGLPAMRSRVASLGGTFTVESAPGQGTAVAVTLPLPTLAGDAAEPMPVRGSA